MELLFALLCFLIVGVLQGQIYKRYWDKNLSVELKFQTLECVEGEKNLLKEVITNAKKLPLPILHVKFRTSRTFLFDNEENSAVSDYYYRDDIFTVQGQQIVTRQLSFVCSKRGCYMINDISLVSNDLLFSRILVNTHPTDTLLYVFPAKLDLSDLAIPYESITGDFITKHHLLEDPFEFRGIRDYQPYDSMRSINWKSSAKYNSLLVNTYHSTSSRQIKIYLNLEKHALIVKDDILEYAIRIASTLAHQFISDQVPISLETNGCDLFTKNRIYIGAGSGNAHSNAIDRNLARIDVTQKPTDFLALLKEIMTPEEDNNTYYVIISNNRKPELMRFYSDMKEREIPGCFIIPEQKTEIAEQITLEDIYYWEVPDE